MIGRWEDRRRAAIGVATASFRSLGWVGFRAGERDVTG